MTMKHPRPEHQEEAAVSLALSLSTDSSSPASTTSDSATAATAASKSNKRRRRGPLVATSGEGEFVCKTCGRAFPSFQALGGHRTSHLRGRNGLDLGVGAKALRQHKQAEAAAAAGGGKDDGKSGRQAAQHECHICGLGFELGQALGGHMRRHREEMGAADAADQWVWRPDGVAGGRAANDSPVLLELFV